MMRYLKEHKCSTLGDGFGFMKFSRRLLQNSCENVRFSLSFPIPRPISKYLIHMDPQKKASLEILSVIFNIDSIRQYQVDVMTKNL